MATEATTELPRGVRSFDDPSRPKPFAVQWRVDGKRKTKFFDSAKRRDGWAETLAKDVRVIGPDAYRLDGGETQAWREFRLLVGDAKLEDVARVWLKFGKGEPTSTLIVSTAVESYLKVKEAEGIAKATQSHSKVILRKFERTFGKLPAVDVKREEIADWVSKVSLAAWTRNTHLARLKSFFNWLRLTRQIVYNPCDGIKAVAIIAEEIPVLTPAQCATLFAKNRDRKELVGRLALEAFAGMRYSSAAKFEAKDIRWVDKGLVLPAKNIKTRRRQFIDGLTDNLFAWLKWSEPDKWTMTARDYLQAKSLAFVRADVPHPNNVLRHSCATYLVAHLRDVGKAAAILCHSPAMLFRHYRGNATQADGDAWFKIVP